MQPHAPWTTQGVLAAFCRGSIEAMSEHSVFCVQVKNGETVIETIADGMGDV